MVASSLLSDAAFVSDGSSYAVHQLVLLLGSAMTALNACVEAKEKEATWEVTTHHCLASLGFIAGFVPFLKDASILEDFCRYVMSVLPCVLEANLADEVLVKDVVLLMEKMSRFVDGEKRDDVMGEVENVVVEKKVLVSAELEKRCEEEEESDSSSYTYESYYSYETVSDEELPPSMPTLVSAPEKPEKEKPVEEEDWGFEEEEKKDEDWGFDEKEEEKEEVKEPVEENVEVKKVEVKEDKKDKKKAEVNEEKKEEKPEEKKVKEEVKEEKKPVEEKKKEPSADKNSTSTALARTEKKLEVDEHLWDDDDEPVKPARATRRGRKKEEVKEEKKAEVKKEEKEEEKPVAKPVEEAKPEVKKEEKPVEEKPEEKTEEKEEKKVEVKKEEEKKPSVDKNSTSTALARTEKKLEVDEHLWDDDDEPVKPARATRRGRKKEKAPVERVVIEPPLRSEKLFSDDEEEKKPKKTRRGRSGRSQALATFEASWDEEEEKPAEKVEEKPVEEVKVEKKEEKAEEKEKKEEENWDFASDGNDSSLEWSDQEQSATAPTPTNTPTTPTNTPTPTTPTNTPTTPITIISSTTVASYTAVPDMMPLCTSPTTISPVLLQACRVLDLLLSSSLLLPACHCFQCYIPAVKKEPSLLCHFVDKLVRQIGAREMKEEEAKALTEIVTILVEDNECVTRAASDLALELFLAFQKKEEVSCIPKQLVLLVLSFYQQKREPWLITVFIHMFSAALSHHSMEQVTQCLVMLAATLQKLNAEDSQFLIAVCGMPIIDAILSVWSVMDKEALAALVPFAALLYGKTEKKEEIVELVLHLCGIALKRSIQLQPLNVKKCDEDADLVKVNSMIGELLFVMVRVNAESFKKGLQCLPAEKVSVIQEQLRHTIQVKQSETNAAKRRNASRMPVKLDASKFTNE